MLYILHDSLLQLKFSLFSFITFLKRYLTKCFLRDSHKPDKLNTVNPANGIKIISSPVLTDPFTPVSPDFTAVELSTTNPSNSFVNTAFSFSTSTCFDFCSFNTVECFYY